jgi:hypothetical protein
MAFGARSVQSVTLAYWHGAKAPGHCLRRAADEPLQWQCSPRVCGIIGKGGEEGSS